MRESRPHAEQPRFGAGRPYLPELARSLRRQLRDMLVRFAVPRRLDWTGVPVYSEGLVGEGAGVGKGLLQFSGKAIGASPQIWSDIRLL